MHPLKKRMLVYFKKLKDLLLWNYMLKISWKWNKCLRVNRLVQNSGILFIYYTLIMSAIILFFFRNLRLLQKYPKLFILTNIKNNNATTEYFQLLLFALTFRIFRCISLPCLTLSSQMCSWVRINWNRV